MDSQGTEDEKIVDKVIQKKRSLVSLDLYDSNFDKERFMFVNKENDISSIYLCYHSIFL